MKTIARAVAALALLAATMPSAALAFEGAEAGLFFRIPFWAPTAAAQAPHFGVRLNLAEPQPLDTRDNDARFAPLRPDFMAVRMDFTGASRLQLGGVDLAEGLNAIYAADNDGDPFAGEYTAWAIGAGIAAAVGIAFAVGD